MVDGSETTPRRFFVLVFLKHGPNLPECHFPICMCRFDSCMPNQSSPPKRTFNHVPLGTVKRSSRIALLTWFRESAVLFYSQNRPNCICDALSYSFQNWLSKATTCRMLRMMPMARESFREPWSSIIFEITSQPLCSQQDSGIAVRYCAQLQS